MNVRVGLYRKLSTEELMLLNCGVGEKTLESPLDNKEISQSVLKEINSEYLLKELMLKPQYFGHLMRRANPLKKTLVLAKIEGRKRRG